MIRRALFLFALICMISSVYSVTTISSLPYTISTPGDYNISGNLSSTGNGITFTTSNASLNCEGYTMTGDAGSWESGIYINGYNYNNITNCKIYNFERGILLKSVSYSNFTNLTLNSTYSGFHFSWGSGTTENYFTNIITNKGFSADTFNAYSLTGTAYFNNVSDGNGKYIISSINTPITIDGWTNVSSIYLYNADNSVIKNLNINGIENYTKSIFLFITSSSSSVNISNINISNYENPFFLTGYSSINMENLSLSNGYYGLFASEATINSNNLNFSNYTICVDKGSTTVTINNSYFNQCSAVVFLSQSSNFQLYNSKYINSSLISLSEEFNTQSHCTHVFNNVTDENDKYFFYSYQNINIDGWTNLSSIHLCNADNSSIKNLNVNGFGKNLDFIYIRYTDYSNFTNITISNYSKGINLNKNANNNTFQNVISNNNLKNGIYFYESSANNFINLTCNYNLEAGIYFYGYPSNYNNFSNFRSNYNLHGIYASGGGYNNFINFTTNNNNQYGITGGSNNNYYNFTINYNWQGIAFNSVSNNNFNKFESSGNTAVGVNLFFSSYNNFSNFEINSISGLSFESSSNNNIINFTIENSTQNGIYLSSSSNNNLINFTSKDNGQRGIYLSSSSNNNISIFNINNNTLKGIRIYSNSDNNLFFTGTSINNTQENLYFQESGSNKPENNTFYNNRFGNISKIYSNNWANINYFNSSLSGYNIGNYWNDLGVCSSYELRGSYKVCLNPANYTLNSSNNIYDFAPLIVVPEYISPTPDNDTHFGGDSFTITVEDTQGVSTWFNVTFNDVTYVMTNTSSTVYEYTFYPDYNTVTEITYYVSYSGDGMLETRVLTYYPTPSAFQRVPAFSLVSYILTIILIIFGGFLA